MESLLKNKKIIVGVAAFLLVESVVVVLWLGGRGATVPAATAVGATGSPMRNEQELVEIVLGDEFRVKNTVDPGMPMQIDFGVVALVHKDNVDTFNAVIEERRARINEAIVTAVRKASPDTIHEPNFARLKQQVKEAVARVLGPDKPYVEDIILLDYNPINI
jgi:hypothetical protein